MAHLKPSLGSTALRRCTGVLVAFLVWVLCQACRQSNKGSSTHITSMAFLHMEDVCGLGLVSVLLVWVDIVDFATAVCKHQRIRPKAPCRFIMACA